MSEVQIPSTKLNTYLKNPQGGVSISEAEEYIQPTLDVLEFLYPTVVEEIQIRTEAGETVNIPLVGGAGVYRLKIALTGYIQGAVGGGEHSLDIDTVAGSNDTLNLFNVMLSASQILNVMPVYYEMYYDVVSDEGQGLVLTYFTTSAPTKIELDLCLHIQRIQ